MNKSQFFVWVKSISHRNKMMFLFTYLLLLLSNGVKADGVITAFEEQPYFYPVRERMLVKSLNGTWKIKIVKGLTVPTEYSDWEKNGYNDTSWDNIEVPGNWETQGYKVPEYGNQVGEYTGLYRTRFKYNQAWNGQHVILRFDGVHFGYECYINGYKVGQWGSAFNLCQFDITPYLRQEGSNELCVKVTTRAMGWEFDTNDCWALVGITRNVELFTVNNTYLEDVSFVSEVTSELDANIHIRVDVNQFNDKEKDNLHLNVSLSDLQNNHLVGFTHSIKTDTKVYNFEGKLKRPALWTAETPNLHRLEVCITDNRGVVIQRVNEYVGIRSIKIDGFDLKINNRPVLLHGVCLNEIDPKSGRALSYEERRNQLRLMKEANINFIRTAHYPFSPDLLKLCDEMGFYVCDEVPFGARGQKNLYKDEFIPELQARAEATIRRDKNRPSVIIWSLGNENPYTPVVEEVLKYVKKKDPTRPRGLPQQVGEVLKFVRNPSENVDIIMGHYLNNSGIDEVVKYAQKPIIHTEYAHSQGVAFGDFEERYMRILNEKKVVGGSIWCWSDQAVLTDGKIKTGYSENLKSLPRDARRDLPEEYQGIWIDPVHFMDTFGDRGSDGIVYADGYPKEDYYLVRKMYSPVVILTNALKGKVNRENIFDLEIENRFDFTSLHGYQLKWNLRNLHHILDSGSIGLKTLSHGKENVSLNVHIPETAAYNDVMLCMEILNPVGAKIYERNLSVELDGLEKDYNLEVHSVLSQKKQKVQVSKTGISVAHENFSYKISDKGIFTVTDKSGHQLIQSPLLLRVGRPETMILKIQTLRNKFCWIPYMLAPVVENFATKKTKDEVQVLLTCRWYRDEESKQYIEGDVNIHIKANGVVWVEYNLQSSKDAVGSLLECGLTLKMGEQFDVFHWLGLGPYSSTPGKSAYNERSIWALHRDDIRFNGNRSKVDIGMLDNKDQGIGILSGNGNIGIENIDGSIYVSQNIAVAGYGTKFYHPANPLSAKDLAVKGSLTLFVENLKEQSSILRTIFDHCSDVVPEQPYYKHYGW